MLSPPIRVTIPGTKHSGRTSWSRQGVLPGPDRIRPVRKSLDVGQAVVGPRHRAVPCARRVVRVHEVAALLEILSERLDIRVFNASPPFPLIRVDLATVTVVAPCEGDTLQLEAQNAH